MVAARHSISRVLTQSQPGSYVCRACRNHLSRVGPSFHQQRFASNFEQSTTEPTRRRSRGSTKARGLTSSYGGTTLLERQNGQGYAQPDEPDMATLEPASVTSATQSLSTRTSAQFQLPTTTDSPTEYVPAETWEGLQYIGSTGHWRDNPPQPGDNFTSWLQTFSHVTTDRQELVSCLHQAIAECLTCKQAGLDPASMLHLDAIYVPKSMLSTLTTASIKSSQSGVPEQVQYTSEDQGKKFTRLLADIDAAIREPPPKPMSEEQTASESITEKEYAELEEAYDSEMGYEPEQELNDTMPRYVVQDDSFLKLHLDAENPITFFILKRFSQLAGHHIPDPIINTLISTKQPLSFLIEQLYHMVVRPKPKQLAEILMNKPGLINQSNVMIFPRRETPVDKEKEVGRWKVIEKELKDRGLPVLGRLKA